jgi:hypothetical protein
MTGATVAEPEQIEWRMFFSSGCARCMLDEFHAAETTTATGGEL